MSINLGAATDLTTERRESKSESCCVTCSIQHHAAAGGRQGTALLPKRHLTSRKFCLNHRQSLKNRVFIHSVSVLLDELYYIILYYISLCIYRSFFPTEQRPSGSACRLSSLCSAANQTLS